MTGAWGKCAALMIVASASATARAADALPEPPSQDSIASVIGWPDPRAPLKAAGIELGYSYIGEYFNVVAGGVNSGGSFNGRLEQTLYVDLAKMAGWRDARFHAHVFAIHGEGPGEKHFGNAMTISNIEALETVRLSEMWLEQAWFDGRLNVRIGQLTADSEFFLSDTASQFFNGTFGWPGTTAANMVQGGPAYPLAAPGVRIQWQADQQLTLLAAVYNGSPAHPLAINPQRDNRYGLDFRFGDPPLVMAEAQYAYRLGLAGKVKVGGWHEFSTFEDKLTGTAIDGNSGIYAVVDQALWRNAAGASVNMLGRVSAAPSKQNEISFYADAGIVAQGLLASRPKDTIGLAFGYGRVSTRTRDRERADGESVISDYGMVVELNYSAQITPGWTLSPDFHYVWHPGNHAENPKHPDRAIAEAVVLGLRTKIDY